MADNVQKISKHRHPAPRKRCINLYSATMYQPVCLTSNGVRYMLERYGMHISIDDLWGYTIHNSGNIRWAILWPIDAQPPEMYIMHLDSNYPRVPYAYLMPQDYNEDYDT